MKILVGVKRVVDYAVKVRVGNNHLVDLSNTKMSMNPFCEIAVEEAIRLKESKVASQVIAVSIGPKQCGSETLRTALAMGCDSGIHVMYDEGRTDSDLQPYATSKIMAQLAQTHDASLVLLGKQSIDSDCGQTGPMLAGWLGWPQVTFAANVNASGDALEVERETDFGTETLKVQLPAVVTCDLRLNEPRYATLPNIMKAKKKPIETLNASELGIDLEPKVQVETMMEPPPRKEGIMVESVDDLLEKLKNDNVIGN